MAELKHSDLGAMGNVITVLSEELERATLANRQILKTVEEIKKELAALQKDEEKKKPGKKV